MNEEKQTPLISADHPLKSKDSSTKQELMDTSTKWDSTDQVRILLFGALYGPLGSSSPSARHLLQTLLKKLDGSTPGMRESPSTTAMVGLETVVNQEKKSAPQVNASKASQGLADVDMKHYNTTGDSLANSQVPSIQDDDETTNKGSSCQEEVMKDESEELPSNEINAVVPQGSADVDMQNYDTTGDSLANSQVPSIEDDDETTNKGSSCQQEVMKDESAALSSNDINPGVPDQDSNSFYLRSVSMAAKNRVHSLVLDLVNTTSSQLDTSSHLNQPELTTSESVKAGPGPVNEDSSGYSKVLMVSLKGKDSSESTVVSSEKKSSPQVNASKASQGLADVDMKSYNTTGDSLANSQVPSIEDDDETTNKGSSCQEEVMRDESVAHPTNEINVVVPQGSADVDMDNYDTAGDSLANSQVPSIEDDDETTNKGSSCQQEVMKDESAELPSNEINPGVSDQDSNPFYLRNVSMAVKRRVHSFVLDLVNTTSTQLDTSSHLNQPELTTSESVEACPGPVNEDSSGYSKVLMLSLKGKDSSESTAVSSGASKECASPVWEINEVGYPPSLTAQSSFNDSRSAPAISGGSIDIDLETTCDTEATGEPSAPSSGGSMKINLDTADKSFFSYNAGASLKKESYVFGIPATSSDVDANQVITKSSRIVDFLIGESPSLNDAKEQGPTWDSLGDSRVSSIVNEVEASKNSILCEMVNESPSIDQQSDDKCYVDPLRKSPGLQKIDLESSGIISFCCDGEKSVESKISPSYSKSSCLVAKISTGSENSKLVSKGNKRKRKRSVPESLDTSEKESDEPLQKSQCLIMETNLHQTDEPLPKVPWLAVEKTDSSTAKVTIEHMHPPGELTDSWTLTDKGISPEAEGKTRKRKRRDPESLDTSEKECDEPLRKSRCLVAGTNDKFPQAEELDSLENVARVKGENATNPEALEYAHLCIRNAYHALLGAGILEHRAALMAPENLTIEPQAEIRAQVKPYKRKRRRRRN